MTYAFMQSLHGTDDLDHVMDGIEYTPHTNPHRDPFSVVWNVNTLLFNAFGDNMLSLCKFLARIRMRL